MIASARACPKLCAIQPVPQPHGALRLLRILLGSQGAQGSLCTFDEAMHDVCQCLDSSRCESRHSAEGCVPGAALGALSHKEVPCWP